MFYDLFTQLPEGNIMMVMMISAVDGASLFFQLGVSAADHGTSCARGLRSGNYLVYRR